MEAHAQTYWRRMLLISVGRNYVTFHILVTVFKLFNSCTFPLSTVRVRLSIVKVQFKISIFDLLF